MALTCQICTFQNASGLKSRHEFASPSLFYSPTSGLTPAWVVSRVTPCHSRKCARIGGMLKSVQSLEPQIVTVGLEDRETRQIGGVKEKKYSLAARWHTENSDHGECQQKGEDSRHNTPATSSRLF
jgi:hypothetical protein